MGLIMQEGKFVSRDEVTRIDTPCSTDTWRPVPHIDVIDAVTKVVRAHNWEIEGEKFGLARDGQKMFGVMEISLNNFIAEMRDATIQKDRLRFRTNLERVGEIFAYELSKELTYTEKDVVTPLGIARVATSDTASAVHTPAPWSAATR